MVDFTLSGNSVKVDLDGIEVHYLSTSSVVSAKVSSGIITISAYPAVGGTVFSFYPTEINGRGSDDLLTVAEWLRDTYFVGVTMASTGTVDIGDVTILNGTGDSAVNIRDGGNSITVDGAISITDGAGTVNTKQLGTPITNSDVGLVTNSVIHGQTTAGGGTYVDVKVNPSGALSVDATLDETTVTLDSSLIGTQPAITTKGLLLGKTDGGRYVDIPVTPEGHLEVAIHSPRLPFGEIEVGELEPVFQTDAVYGINTTEVITSTDGVSGTATAESNLFSVGTGGTTAGYFASIQSRKRLRYRPGQGVVARFTMLFSAGIANNIQVVGVGTSESTFAFGYNGTAFGILHSTGGVRCINTLTISVGSTANTTATVTLNNVAYNVSVTNSSSAIMTAYEISKGTYAGWTATQRGDTVVFLANSVGVKSSTYSVSFGAGTGAGTFPGTPTLVGVAPSDVWIPQSSWNGDVCDGTGSASNPSGFNLIPTYGNVAKIGIQYLGFGAVTFGIEAAAVGNNPDFVNVHTIRFPNSQATVSVSQPSFPFLMSSYNIGTTSGAITTKCGSFAGFIAGKKKLSGPRMSYFSTNGVTSSTSAYTPIFTIKNDITYKGRANQAIINLLSISGATKGNANSITTFYVIRNVTLSAGTPNFVSFSTTSCSYWDTASTACTFATNDQVVWSTTVTQDGQFIFSFTDEITLQPGETITLAVRSVTATSTCIGQINTREDQ